jgi:S1-C subfamily serine protease
MNAMRVLIVSLILAASALAADCGNCQGTRVVGKVPLFFPCPSCYGTGDLPDAAKAEEVVPAGRPRPAVCRVVSTSDKYIEAGTGVLVRVNGTSGLVLTAYHVVRGNRPTLEVTFPEGRTLPARIVAWDQDWDLAALAVGRPEAEPVPISAKAPRRGDRLTIAGYGQVGVYREQTGCVTDYGSPTKSHPAQFVEVEVAARSGDSGGPIFDSNGELAGVLFGVARGRTIGSCSTRLSLFLAEADSKVPACTLCETAK